MAKKKKKKIQHKENNFLVGSVVNGMIDNPLDVLIENKLERNKAFQDNMNSPIHDILKFGSGLLINNSDEIANLFKGSMATGGVTKNDGCGGKGEPPCKTLYVNSKKDPRYIAYQDSLKLHTKFDRYYKMLKTDKTMISKDMGSYNDYDMIVNPHTDNYPEFIYFDREGGSPMPYFEKPHQKVIYNYKNTKQYKETIKKQQKLKNAGIDIIVDGIWGKKSKKAYEEYLSKNKNIEKKIKKKQNRKIIYSEPVSYGMYDYNNNGTQKIAKKEYIREWFVDKNSIENPIAGEHYIDVETTKSKFNYNKRNSFKHNKKINNNTSKQFGLRGVTGSNVEVEGGEIIETPNGEAQEVKGPSHEYGGVNMLLPDFTKVFSKRLKGEDGKTYADRKKERERLLKKAQKDLDKDPLNKVKKRTLEKIQKNNELLDNKDLSEMDMFKSLLDTTHKMAYGGFTGGIGSKDLIEDGDDKILIDALLNESMQSKPFNINNLNIDTYEEDLEQDKYIDSLVSKPKNNFIQDNLKYLQKTLSTPGNMLGYLGAYKAYTDPLKNVEANRASDTLNKNHYKNYGEEALLDIQNMGQYASQIKDQNLTELNDSRRALMSKTRNSARGVNTMRALDLSANNSMNKASNKVYAQLAEQMMKILNLEASQKNQMDKMQMMGEEKADLANRQDKDNYYTQKGSALAGRATNLQSIGALFNTQKKENVIGKLVNSKYNNYSYDELTNDIKFKSEEQINTKYPALKNVPLEHKLDVHNKLLRGEYIYDETKGVIKDKKGNIIY